MKKLLALLLVVATLFCVAACGGNEDSGKTTTTTTAPTTTVPADTKPDPADEANWDKVVNDVFTAKNGGLQMAAEGWKTYAQMPTISMVPVEYTGTGYTNAVCVAVYEPDSADVFAAKTKEDFETVLQVGLDTFEPTTVCGYTAYKAVATNVYYVWVVNTPNAKYFINFMQAPDGAAMETIGAAMMETVEIFK